MYSIVRVGKRTHTTAHSAVGEDHKKYKCKKIFPLVPRYILQTYHEIGERTWINRSFLANI